MFNKALKILSLLLLFVAILYAADDKKDNAENNIDNTDKAKIEFILNKMKDEKTVYAPVLRDIVNSDPEKYLKILNEVKGKFSLQANRLTLEFIHGIEEYKDGKDFIDNAGTIINYDFKLTQLAVVETKSWSNLGWLVRSNASDTNSFYLMSKTLEIEKYDAKRYEHKILDWLTIFNELEGKYRSTLKFDSFYVAAEMSLWAWIGLCKGDYIAAGLAWDSCKEVLSRTSDDKNSTKPDDSEMLKHGKQKVCEILADYKLKQIKNSTKFDNSFENILKSLQTLNAAFSTKCNTKTELETLTQQFGKTKKFLDDTSSETEQNKPLNKLIRAIINSNVNCPSPTSHFMANLGCGTDDCVINNKSFPLNFVLSDAKDSQKIWDLLGDFLPEDHSQLFELLNCDYISRGFFNVQNYITIFLSHFDYKNISWDIRKTTTKENFETLKSFFNEMPANRPKFYTKLHQTVFVLRTFALNELAQTNYDDLKKLLLEQQNLKDITTMFNEQLTRGYANTNDDILRQFAVFISFTNKKNFDADFFKQLFESKYNNDVLYVLAEMLWRKLQSTAGFKRLSQDLRKENRLKLTEIKARINLLQVMSHTSKELAESFKKLMLNLMECKNEKVQFALFQIFQKHDVPDSFIEKVHKECKNKKILFHKPDVDNFPMMLSNLAMSIIANKNELPESYRMSASYFDRKIMFAFLMKILGNGNEYEAFVKKYKVEDEKVPENLAPLKQLILDYLCTTDATEQKNLYDKILNSPGAWDALRLSGRDRSEVELQKLLQLADDVSRKIKMIEHLSNDKTDEKLMSELNALKGKSLSYLKITELAKNLAIKFNLDEAAMYAERLPNGKGLRLMVYTVKSTKKDENRTDFSKILGAKYTRNGISRLIKSTDFSNVKGVNLLENAVEEISNVSIKYITSQIEFYYHIKS